MFGVGLPELFVIGIVAILIFGPDRMPEIAKQAGVFVRRARAMAQSARDEIREELGPDFADLELRDLDPRTLVRKHILDALDDDGPAEAKRLPAGDLPPFDVDAT